MVLDGKHTIFCLFSVILPSSILFFDGKSRKFTIKVYATLIIIDKTLYFVGLMPYLHQISRYEIYFLVNECLMPSNSSNIIGTIKYLEYNFHWKMYYTGIDIFLVSVSNQFMLFPLTISIVFLKNETFYAEPEYLLIDLCIFCVVVKTPSG